MFSLCCSPLSKPEKCRTFLLSERMLQMSANESCGNDLWPKLLLAGWRNKSPRRPGAPASPVDSIISLELRNWFLWFARDSEALAAAPDGEACWRGGRHWITAVVRPLDVWMRERAKRGAVCHSHCRQLDIRRSHFGHKALRLFLLATLKGLSAFISWFAVAVFC